MYFAPLMDHQPTVDDNEFH